MSTRDHTPPELRALRLHVEDLEAELAAAPEACLHAVFDDMFEGIQILDYDFRYAYLNETAARHGRRTRAELTGHRMTETFPGIERTEMFERLRSCMTQRIPHQMLNEFTYPDGSTAWFDLRMSPTPMGVLILSVDVSERKVVEEELRRSREDLETTLDCMAEGVIATDVEGRVTRMNAAAQALTGWAEAEAKGRALDELVGFVTRSTCAPLDHIVDRVLEHGLKIGLANDTQLVARDGTRTPIASSAAPIRDAGDAIRGVVLVLKNTKEEQELSAMLQRAQKMEALGRLAGGIAHDFNNLLTVISGHCDLLIGQLPPDDPMGESIAEIKQAGERAASLTRQLLVFSRQQVLNTAIVDMNAVVIDTEKMLARLIGEDITLATVLEPGLGRVEADPGQIEQVIMNLAVNARDAMPKGGKLTVQTANVELDGAYVQSHMDVQPGRYVMLAVSDTGCGMDDATRARIFEPFFTTKGPGKGTGLGLATVFGIVKQSGGHIWVYSEVDHGSTFKIYLPLVEQATRAARRPPRESIPGGTETILLVEDDDAVRGITVSSLEMFGYTVLASRDGHEAMDLSRSHGGPIHMLISDVIMPELGGREVAERLLQSRPDTKILYVSGYTDDAVVRHGILQEQVAFLQKPFTPSTLARKVREVLGDDDGNSREG